MILKLVQKYRRGQLTASHVAVQCLHMIDPMHPALVLEELPPAILKRMERFVTEYQQGKMVTNYGVLPAVDQVEAARVWIASHPASLQDRDA